MFGQKDFQQAALIRRMTDDLDMAVRVEVAPIVRAADGLALSSRNTYLSAAERERALTLSRALQRCAALFATGEDDARALSAAVRETLAEPGVETEYAELVDPISLRSVDRVVPGTVCAVAARVGSTRLIDNTVLTR